MVLMSGIRKELLPLSHNWFWTPFFDESIQRVLGARFEADNWLYCSTPAHALAWPLVTYEAMAALAHSGHPLEHVDLLQFYALDPEFTTALLFALTLFVRQPATNWSFDRKLLEVEQRKWDPNSKSFLPSQSWQEIVELLEPNDKSLDRAKAFANCESRERARRRKILAKWKSHFKAKDSGHLTIDDYPLDAAPRQAFPIAYFPPHPINKRGK
jgi:hypothetical protein